MLLSQWLKERKKTVLITAVAFLVLMAALITVFTFFDRQASTAMYSPGSAFGKIFEVFGYLPAIIVDSLLFACFYVLTGKKGVKILFHILIAVALAGGVYTVFASFETENPPSYYSAVKYSVMTVAGIGLSFLLVLGFKRIRLETIKKLTYIMLIGAIMATLSVMLVYLFKYVWGRTRFKDLGNSEAEYFTMWFIPRGRTGGESFPSAHAMSACSLILLPLAAWMFNMKKRTTVILTAAAALGIIAVALSRIVIGMHYFTDTLFSVLFSFGTLIVGIVITDKVYKKKNIPPPYEPAASTAANLSDAA